MCLNWKRKMNKICSFVKNQVIMHPLKMTDFDDTISEINFSMKYSTDLNVYVVWNKMEQLQNIFCQKHLIKHLLPFVLFLIETSSRHNSIVSWTRIISEKRLIWKTQQKSYEIIWVFSRRQYLSAVSPVDKAPGIVLRLPTSCV